ncbi:hypothetical protein HPB51_002970 [Rhipicephalus microplus]|uniref:Uncharacterized protein n=1 Tax=Rhipicephalus microplus TaxID=6941 RepID=A0A9J6EJZ9_RHIMP|nr:hypothetical protein HPB51_002970 [Rhipicephalus microplus]
MSDLTKLREEIRKEMIELKSSLERELRKEIRDLKNSVSFLNDEVEKIKKENADLVGDNKSLRSANEQLRTECEAFKKQISQQEHRIIASEQHSRKCNLEIKGIPKLAEEDLGNTLHRIGGLLNVPVTKDDVEKCHRVPAKNASSIPNIILQFRSRSKRDLVLQKAKKTRISTQDLGHVSNTPVFINEHLCPVLKQLFGAAIAKKKAAN